MFVAEPCEKTFCAYGASCHTDPGGEARCRCPEGCPEGGTPVCGTDGSSYINECVLRMTACQRQENLREGSESRRGKSNKG
ncbi:hypothetical protein B566_EDAN008122 [Ephemera danica]|nr:hypothetical protein B566_EDAN008122 [Ephemera danica]